MFDIPPDPEDPPPCPLCEEPVGYSSSCEHCREVRAHAETKGALSALQLRIDARARLLGRVPLYVDGNPQSGISAELQHAIALVLDIGGLPLPPDVVDQARAALISEYGEFADRKHDAQIVVDFKAARAADELRRSRQTFGPDILDRRGESHDATLWFLTSTDGSRFVVSNAEKKSRSCPAWVGGSGGPWGQSLRDYFTQCIREQDQRAEFWIEFALELQAQRADAELKKGDRVHYVVDEQAFTAYVGDHWTGQGRGFAGALFVVRLHDGREFRTNNAWSRGTVPPHLRKFIKPTAVILPREDAAAA